MKKNSKSNGPGRPKYIPAIPKGKFTFTDLEIANGVNPKTGKGKLCTTLTLRKWLKRELGNRRSGAVTLLKDTLADPNSKSGLGRKQYVYQRRVGVKASTSAVSTPKTPRTRKAKAADVTVNVSQATQDYEATKAALLAPTPAVTITPDPTPAPVVEDAAPAPEAIAAETAQVAEVATAAPEPVTA